MMRPSTGPAPLTATLSSPVLIVQYAITPLRVAEGSTPSVFGADGGVDEIHIVYTRFVNMVTQTPEVVRLLPLEVVEGDEPPAPD